MAVLVRVVCMVVEQNTVVVVEEEEDMRTIGIVVVEHIPDGSRKTMTLVGRKKAVEVAHSTRKDLVVGRGTVV